MRKEIILVLIITLGSFLRLFNLSQIPAGISDDEASHGYNAYSLLLTGKDEWGKSYPIFFRESGNYASPLYTYLSIIPVKLLGLSSFSTRLVSALSGILLILLTYLIVKKMSRDSRLSSVAALLVAISPWSIHFSRTAIEANLALTLVALSFYLLLLSLEKKYLFILAAVILSLSAHAYHAQRILSLLYIGIFVYIFREQFLRNKKYLLLGLVAFIIIQLPQFLLLNEPGALKRFRLQNYLSYDFFLENGQQYVDMKFGFLIFIVREFFSQYIAYFSPYNLFFNPDPQKLRSIPDLSVFYSWMFIPFIFTWKLLPKIKFSWQVKLLLLFLLVSPIPAAIARDPFYTLRALPLFWGLTIIISIGTIKILDSLNKRKGISILLILLFVSLGTLYSTYFILLPNERSEVYGYPYQEFTKLALNSPFTHFVLDSEISFPTYIWIAFYSKFDPRKIQDISETRIGENYYIGLQFDGKYLLDNIEIRPIYWIDDIYKDQMLVGTTLSISQKQAKEHKLTKIFEIANYSGEIYLIGYKTHPKDHCIQELSEKVTLNPHCEKILKN